MPFFGLHETLLDSRDLFGSIAPAPTQPYEPTLWYVCMQGCKTKQGTLLGTVLERGKPFVDPFWMM